MTPAYWTLILNGIVAAGGIIGVLLARAGKKGDQELQAVGDQFKRLMDENAFLVQQAKDARVEAREVRTEWEQRWDRQIARCRRVTDQATSAIVRLMGHHTASDETNAEVALRNIRDHTRDDHGDGDRAA